MAVFFTLSFMPVLKGFLVLELTCRLSGHMLVCITEKGSGQEPALSGVDQNSANLM